MNALASSRCRAALRRLHRLEIRVLRIEQGGLQPESSELPDVPISSTTMLLERALEAHGLDMNDPIRTGLSALENDLWNLQRSACAAATDPSRFAEALDRLAQRATLLVDLTRRGPDHG